MLSILQIIRVTHSSVRGQEGLHIDAGSSCYNRFASLLDVLESSELLIRLSETGHRSLKYVWGSANVCHRSCCEGGVITENEPGQAVQGLGPMLNIRCSMGDVKTCSKGLEVARKTFLRNRRR